MLKKLNQSFTIFRLAESDPEAMEILLNASMGHLEASRQMELLGYKVGESSIRKYRSNNNITLDITNNMNNISNIGIRFLKKIFLINMEGIREFL